MTITCPCPTCDRTPNCKCGTARYEAIRRWNERAFPSDLLNHGKPTARPDPLSYDFHPGERD
jgi:hypothetical protein